MTDQEKRYRCPGCGNEESGDLLASFAAVYGTEVHHDHKPLCPTLHCDKRLHDYQLIEAPEAEKKECYPGCPGCKRKPIEDPEPEPEPEGAREWARQWANPLIAGRWHRFPNQGGKAVCGVNLSGDSSDWGSEPEGEFEACPDCLPKPVEGEEPEEGGELCVYCKRHLGEHKQLPSLRDHFSYYCSWPCAAKGMAERLVITTKPYDWTSVEDGLPGDVDVVEIRTTAWWGPDAKEWRIDNCGDEDEAFARVLDRPVTHWRPKPEEKP